MKAKMTFEDCMAELEGIVKALEEGKLPLDEMTTLYERGALLSKKCMDMLDTFEGKLVTLAEEDGA